MPTNREKRPRWLMICKCGATVKASARAAEIDGPALIYHAARRSADVSADVLEAVQGPDRDPALQELGTIDVRSIGVTTPWGVHCGSPARWNSIRRSNALERMNGKRWNTRSRIS